MAQHLARDRGHILSLAQLTFGEVGAGATAFYSP